MTKTRNAMNRLLSRRLAIAILLPVFMFSLVLAVPTVSWAADRSSNPAHTPTSNQAINQPASLVAPKPDAKIAIYRRPEVGRAKAGYGVNGDAVTVLEQVSDNQSLRWNHIRFDNPPYAEGWVQATFLSVSGENGQAQQQPMAGDRYLGNQRSQSSQSQSSQRNPSNQQQQQPQSRQSYSQRNQN